MPLVTVTCTFCGKELPKREVGTEAMNALRLMPKPVREPCVDCAAKKNIMLSGGPT